MLLFDNLIYGEAAPIHDDAFTCLILVAAVPRPHSLYFTTIIGLSITQPDKIHLQETSDPNWADMQALLRELRASFAAHDSAFTKLLKQAVSEDKISEVCAYCGVRVVVVVVVLDNTSAAVVILYDCVADVCFLFQWSLEQHCLLFCPFLR